MARFFVIIEYVYTKLLFYYQILNNHLWYIIHIELTLIILLMANYSAQKRIRLFSSIIKYWRKGNIYVRSICSVAKSASFLSTSA